MNTPVRSAWILRALIISITAALLITALTKTSWAMPLEPDTDPRSPTRPTATVIVQSAADDGTTVPANCPGASCRLRDALAYASPGDTITFGGDYTITLASELTIDKNLTIDGAGNSVTINGNYAVRVFNIAAGHVTFAHLTIANGEAPITFAGCGGSRCGGGMLLQNSGVVVTVTHSILSLNSAAYDGDNGGGLYNNGGTVWVQNSTFFGNHSGYYGGGIYNNAGTVTVTDSTFANNWADDGGGISNAGSLTMLNTTFANNISDDWVGTGDGGGLWNLTGSAALTNVTFSGNQSVNAAGGGVRVDGGDVTLTNVTLSGNNATTGGGISISSGNVTILNSLIANSPLGGNCSGSLSGSNNLADDATCGVGFTNSSSIRLGTLSDYGGSTFTIPLLPGSSAIDATSTNCPATDQRGVARPQGAACDIGAFEAEVYTITPTAGANGSIAPSTAQLVYRGGSQTFLIAPDIGYQTVDVQVDGVSQGAISLYTFNNVTASHTISASFTNETYTITPSAGAHGSISPATPQTVNHGASLTFNFTPDSGYQVANVLVDGVSQGAINSYTFSNVSADRTIAVSFGIKTYTITPAAGAHGTIAPATPQIVNHGGSVTFNITPDTGYHIADVIVDGVSQGAITSHTFTNVTANHTIAASFAINTYTLSPSAGPNGAISPNIPQTVNYSSSKTFNITPNAGYHIADVLVDGVSQGAISSYTFNNIAANHTIAVSFAINTYTITPSAGPNGSISPNMPQTVNHGGSLTFNFTPHPGYQVVNVLVDGVSQGAIASYTFSNVSADHTIAVSFTGETYVLTPSAGPHGSVSPYAPQTVNHGGSITFNITPDTGYHIADVQVDGVSQGAISAYTFSNVTANHTIAASFAINTYTLSPSAGPNGSISPGTPQTVNYGDSKTFNIAANTGYRIADVRVDGVSQGTPGSYTFSNVTAHHAITAAFTTSGPQTRMAGVITITADSFTDLAGNVTRAMGHIRLGNHLFLTGDTDVVLYTSTTLTATGKLTVRSDNDQIDVLTGSFRASTSNGSSMLIGTPTYQLNRVADWPLVAGLSVSSIDLLASKMNATANLGVQVYEIDATVPVNFAIAGTSNDIVYSGLLGAFDFTLGGITLTVASGATVSNIGITAPGVTLTLPSVLGGASGNLNGLSITKYGVIIPDSTITLPEIKYGDGSKLRITDTVANLMLANDAYKFTVNSTLYISLPGNLINTPVSFTIANGELTGTVDTLDLTLAGAQLGLQNMEISNNGLAVAEATLTLPESLGGATTTLTEVSINSDGLNIGSGRLQLAEIKIGDGSKVKIIRPTATISATTAGYSFGVSGTLQLRLPQNSQDIAIDGSIDTDGNFAATLDQITLKLANVDLRLSDIAMNNSGLSVVSGTLQLPPKLGGVSGVVNNVSITANGLSIEGGAATLPIPNFKIGGSSGFSVSNARAKLIMTNNGSAYRLQIDGTVAIAVRGSNASATGTITVDDAGNLSGSVSTFSFAVAGLTLTAKNININSDGSLAVGAADLKLPSGFGGAAASVYNVSLGNGEVSIGGGKFTLPEIKAGGFRLKDLGASLIKVTGGYEISAKGFASFPAVSGGAGCKGIGVSATLFVNAQGQTELALAPDRTNGLSLKEASFNFECQIPIGTTGFSITGLSGAVTLSENSTQVNVALQIATSRKIADMSVLSADVQAQLISDPFDLSITGAVRVFIFQVGGASAHLTSNNFSATLWVDMRVASGNISLNAWSDYRGFHLNGTGNMTVGLARGSIFNGLSVPYPCCDCGWQWSWGIPYWWCGNCRTCWTEGVTVPPSDWIFNTGTEFGEFAGDRWGVKGTVSLLGYSAGFFVDNQGNLSVGNVDNYRLVQPLQVNQAAQKWQEAKLNGLAEPETAWEVDGIQFAHDSIIVNQTLTTTTDVIFALQRNQSAPTLTLMTPLGVEITSNNLPGHVQFTEVLTYTRNVSPTTTPAMAQTTNRVSLCVSPQAVQGAEQTALVRLTHARSDLGTIDVLLDGVKAFVGLDFGAESSVQVIEAGPHTIELVPANQPGPIVYSTEITITGNTVHRLIAAGDMTNTATLDLVQGTAPVAGQATIRFAHASPDAPSIDVVLGNDGRILWDNIDPWSTTNEVNLEAGKPYTFEVYATGTTQLLAQLPNITLTGRGTYSLIALGRMIGTPALQLAMQADTLPLSQVRLVNALAADQPITMWTQGITIFANLPFSATTAYNGFANSAIELQLTSADISNTLLYSGSFPLQAEADHTLVTSDYVTQTQAILLVDDNHVPPWGKTRVRFVHASPNVPAVDVGVQGGAIWLSDVAYLNASSYLELDGGSMTLEVRDHATASVLLTVPDVNLIDGYVYTLFLMGVNGGSPALQLVPRIDVATVPDIQTQYVVHQAQTGTWGMKLNGNIAATDHYMLTMLGSNPVPTLIDLSAGISRTTALTTSWRLTSDELGTSIGIYANPGPITAGLLVTDDFIYIGQALATNLSSDDPNWVDGSLQTQAFDLKQLPSGTYHIWVEANDGRNTPVRQYAPEPLVVDHTASWPLTWTAVMTLTPGFREVNVQWPPHPHADVDGYVLNVAAPTLSETLVISTGNSTSASVTALDPGQPYSLTLHAVDNETGNVSQSQTVIGVPDGALFTLTGSTDAINLLAGQSQSLAVTLVAGKEPYPGVVGLQVGCVHQIGADCNLSIGGLTALFNQALVTPTLAGAAVPVVISSTETLAAGTYSVPITASGNGLSHTLEVAVMIQTQDIAVTAPNIATLGQDQTLDLPIATAGINGASRSIGLHIDNVPAGLLWSLDRNTLLPGEGATLSITDTVLLASGVYTLDIIGDDGLHASSAHIVLTVSKPRFALTAPATGQIVAFGSVKIATFELDVTPFDGWAAPVTLVFDPDSVPALGAVGLTRDPAAGEVASTLVVTPTERVYLTASTKKDTPPGQYTLIVEAEAGGRQQTLDLTLTVKRMDLYLPLIIQNYVSAPDLVVTSLKASTGNVRVVIKNQGDQLVTDGFYVDVYINPNPVPTAVNQTWSDGRSTQGLTWGVTSPLQPGQVLTLTIGDAYYLAEYSIFAGTLPIGTPVYAQVDVFDPTTTYGVVRENHEINGAPYNNILGPVLSTAALELAHESSAASHGEYFLPIRLKVH